MAEKQAAPAEPTPDAPPPALTGPGMKPFLAQTQRELEMLQRDQMNDEALLGHIANQIEKLEDQRKDVLARTQTRQGSILTHQRIIEQWNDDGTPKRQPGPPPGPPPPPAQPAPRPRKRAAKPGG